jgi:hypothetical protein
MKSTVTTRVGAAAGVVFGILLAGINGNGGGAPSPGRAAFSIVALTCALVFVATVSGRVMRRDQMLGSIALAGGTAGILLKVMAGAVKLTTLTTAFADQSDAHRLVDALDNSATVIALDPMAVFCLAVAAGGFASRAVPRWLAGFAAVTGVALAVNATFVKATFVPALLLFALWVLVAGIHLLLRPADTRPSEHAGTLQDTAA